MLHKYELLSAIELPYLTAQANWVTTGHLALKALHLYVKRRLRDNIFGKFYIFSLASISFIYG